MKTKTRRFSVRRKQSPFTLFTSAVADTVAIGIKSFLEGKDTERCLVCGAEFEKEHRYHFLCSRECRIDWHRGRIHPRSES